LAAGDGVLIDPIAVCLNHALATDGLPERFPEELHGLIGPPLSLVCSELIAQPPDSAAVAGGQGGNNRRSSRHPWGQPED
jgi:hypothetical protein